MTCVEWQFERNKKRATFEGIISNSPLAIGSDKAWTNLMKFRILDMRVHGSGCWGMKTCSTQYEASFANIFQVFLHSILLLEMYADCLKWAHKKDTDDYFGAFSTMALNYNGNVKPHKDRYVNTCTNKDRYDSPHSLCFIVPFGNFSGGALHFPDLAAKAILKPGDVICFESKHLLHYVDEYQGIRNSLVFFNDSSVVP